MILRALVERIAREQSAFVPDFNPAGPREHARILFLLQDPGALGAASTGVLCPWHNQDQTARNNRSFIEEAGIRREDCLFWNAVPWVINPNPGDSRAPRVAEKKAGSRYLLDLVELLPQLAAIVAQGASAQDTCRRAGRVRVPVIETPHPGARAANQCKNKPGGWKRFYIEPLRKAARLAGGAS